MFFPTIFSDETKMTHIVKNKHYCECGASYSMLSTFTKNDLRNIKFKHFDEVTCLGCKQSMFKAKQTPPMP